MRKSPLTGFHDGMSPQREGLSKTLETGRCDVNKKGLYDPNFSAVHQVVFDVTEPGPNMYPTGYLGNPSPDSDNEYNNAIQILQLLVEYGADINILDHDGMSPLGHCINQGLESGPVVDFLVSNGAIVIEHPDSESSSSEDSYNFSY